MEVQEAQAYIDSLCRKWDVPIIKVVLNGHTDRFEYASFDGDLYVIEINKKTKKAHLNHEFVHYLLRIIETANYIAEQLADRVKV